MKNLIIDYEYLKEKDIIPEALLWLREIKISNEESLNFEQLKYLQDKHLIKKGTNDVVLRKLGEELITNSLIDASIPREEIPVRIVRRSKRAVKSEVKDNVQKYRDVFKGLKPGSMGDPKACKEKLERWMKENPEYDIKDIINAAEAYIESLNDYTYLQRADYFIYKQERNRSEVSRLSSFIGEKGGNSEWTSELN